MKINECKIDPLAFILTVFYVPMETQLRPPGARPLLRYYMSLHIYQQCLLLDTQNLNSPLCVLPLPAFPYSVGFTRLSKYIMYTCKPMISRYCCFYRPLATLCTGSLYNEEFMYKTILLFIRSIYDLSRMPIFQPCH